MLAFLELTPRFKKLKRRASLEFCVHLEMSQNRNRLFDKQVSGIFKIPNTENVIAILFLSARLKPKRLAKISRPPDTVL